MYSEYGFNKIKLVFVAQYKIVLFNLFNYYLDGLGFKMLALNRSLNATQKYELRRMFLYRMLYWSDWSTVYPGIFRSSIDNFYREALITTGVKWPNALAIDFTGRLLVVLRPIDRKSCQNVCWNHS